MKVITKRQIEQLSKQGILKIYNALPDGYSKEQIEAVLDTLEKELEFNDYDTLWNKVIKEIKQELTKLDKEAER